MPGTKKTKMKKQLLLTALLMPVVMIPQNWDWAKDNGTATVISKSKVKSNSTGDVFSAFTNSFQPSSLVFKRESSAGTAVWSKTIGGMNTFLQDLSVDNSNNSYLLGQFANNLILPDTTLTNSGSYETFIVAYSSNGTRKWVKVLPAGYNGGDFIMNDNAGNLVYASTGPAGSNTISITKYSSSGVQLWQKNYGSTSNLNGLAVDMQSNIHISGSFSGGFTLNGTSYYPSGSTGYANTTFIAKLNMNGDIKKVHTYPGLNLRDFGMDSTSANYYLTGTFSDSAMVGQLKIKTACQTNTSTPAICEESFLAKVDTANISSWAQRNLDDFYRLEVSNSGAVYLTGGFRDSLVLGTVKLKESQSNRKATFVAKFSTLGMASWALKDSAANLASTFSEEIAYSSVGAAYISGTFFNASSNSWFGLNTLPVTPAGTHYFSAKVNENAAPAGITAFERNNNSVKVYPNPNSGRFYIDGNIQDVYNLLGEKLEYEGYLNGGEIELKVPKGIYIIEIHSGKKTSFEKIIIE
jgi:hypothetical protein